MSVALQHEGLLHESNDWLTLLWIYQSSSLFASTVHTTIKKRNHMAPWILLVLYSFSFFLPTIFFWKKNTSRLHWWCILPNSWLLVRPQISTFHPCHCWFRDPKTNTWWSKSLQCSLWHKQFCCNVPFGGPNSWGGFRREVWHFGSLEMGWPTWNEVELFQAVFFSILHYICKWGRDGKISISQVCCRWLFSFSITATVVLLLFLFLLNNKILLIVHPCHGDTSLSKLGNFVTHDAKKGWTCEQGKKLETTISLDIYCSLQVSPSGPT